MTASLDLQPFRSALAEASGAEWAAASRWAVPTLVAEVANLRDDHRELVDRLTVLREEIATRLADENRDRQMIAEHALDVLTDLLRFTR